MLERFPGRTRNALSKRARMLGLKPREQRRGWTVDEDEAIRGQVAEGRTWTQIAGQLAGRSAGAVKKRGRKLGLRPVDAGQVRPSEVRRVPADTWTVEEDAILRKAFDDGVSSWAAIAELLPGRGSAAVQSHATRHLGLKRRAVATTWTGDEDAALRKAIDDGASSLSELVKLLPGRTRDADQCRGRLLGLRVGPAASNPTWSAEEDAALRRMVGEGVHAWRDIAEALPARDDLAEPRSAAAAKEHAKMLALPRGRPS
jgi:hypothetical protein